MAFLPARQRRRAFLPVTPPPVYPWQFEWTRDRDDEMLALYLLGFNMHSIAKRFVHGLTAKDAQVWVGSRLSDLKWRKEIPEDWQRAYHKSPEMTSREGYTLEEDIELLQWRASGKMVINAEIFVKGNRSATGLCRRADWMCGLPGLLNKVERIEQEMVEKQLAAETHFARHRLCGHCDLRREVTEWLMYGMEKPYQKSVMEWLISIDHPTPASECPIVVEEKEFDLAYSQLMAAVIIARERTNDPVVY